MRNKLLSIFLGTTVLTLYRDGQTTRLVDCLNFSRENFTESEGKDAKIVDGCNS